MNRVTKTMLDKSRTAAERAMDAHRKLSNAYDDQTLAPIRQKRIGECYRTRNSYGGDKWWWLYSKIVGVDGSSFVVLHVQRTEYDRVSAEVTTIPGYDGKLMNSYEPMPSDKWSDVVEPLMKELMEMSWVKSPAVK